MEQEISQIYWLLTVVVGVFVPLTHLGNIRRLINGSENRLSLERAKGETDG